MIRSKLKEYADQQYQLPKGILGRYFGEKMVLQHRTETRWTLNLLNVTKEERVLEIGCGAGYAIKQLLKSPDVEYAAGLDLSDSILRSAKSRNRRAIKEGRAAFIQGNVCKIPLDNDMFTKIYSIHSIYFWDVTIETISEIHRVLKNNGSVTITLCTGKNGETWSGVHHMLNTQLLPLMKKAGFKNVKLVKGPDSRQFQTVAVIGDK
ncbi:class I SAM-dependent methyltransferase [Rossellomorea aquimaris]|uniref:Methyltransferase family protein n=1 Tax=Rossellomorea aquimaris TaxID=189382 RepID=A0A366EGF4_9BACI|nr:class I SAM-dependent methyltransferase [Rossellomorea aquimaris]RBP00820.1 methyltransferase family protein [Rossellomorea aquimaris]